MKILKIVFATAVLLLVQNRLLAQQPVNEKDVAGTWKLIIDIDKELEEAKQDLEEQEDSFLENLVLESVTGLVSGVLDELEIYMEFMPDGELEVTVDAFGKIETEASNWFINKDGQLFIEDTESFSSDEYWMLADGMLVNYKENSGKREQNNVYMVKIDSK